MTTSPAILRAKLLATQERRLAQMLNELRADDRYVNMPYRSRRLE